VVGSVSDIYQTLLSDNII